MAITLVQSAKGTSTSTTTTASFSVAPTSGNLVVLAFAGDDANGTPNAGWTQSSEMEQNTFHSGYIWWRISDGSNSLQYTINSASPSAWVLQEFSGVDATPYDASEGQSTSHFGTRQTTYSTPNMTPTYGDRLLVAAVGGSNGLGDNISGAYGTWTNSFTAIDNAGNAGTSGTRDCMGTAYRLVTADGSTAYSTTATYPSSGATPGAESHSGMIIAFREAGSIYLVQSAEGRSATVANTAVSFSTLPTAGNLIVLAWTGNAYVEGFRPEQDGWIQASGIRGSRGAYLWWRIATGSDGNAANAWEFSQTTSATRATWVMAEFSGVDQIDYVSCQNSTFGSQTSYTTPPVVPGSGKRLLIATIAAADVSPGSTSDDDFTSWTNSFTHIGSHGELSNPGEASSCTSMAYRVVTGDDSTSYSTGATFSKTLDGPYGTIASFKGVDNISADTAPALRDIASLTYSSRTNSTVSKPTGTVDGDILIAACFQGQTSATLSNFTAPGGWRLLQGDFPTVGSGGFNGRLLLYWKRASSEGSTYTWTHATSSTQIVITAWSGCVASGTPIDGWTYNAASDFAGEWGQISPNSTNIRLIAVDHNWTGDPAAAISGSWTEHYDTVLLKLNSRELAARGPTTRIQRSSDAPWEGYLFSLRGVQVFPNIAEPTGNSATVSVGSVTVDITAGITQTGSVLQYSITNNSNTGTVSSTITVPSDAQIVIVGVSGYVGPASAWGGAPFESMTFTKGGTDAAMTKVYGGDSKHAVEWQAAMFYLAAPDTGTNKTLKWDWQGTGGIADSTLNFSITFWKGVDAADPVRHQAGNHSSGTGSTAFTTTNPLIAQTGDKIVAWSGFYRTGGTGDGAGSIDTWTNLTELAEVTHNQWAEGAWATGDPTGNVLVGIAAGTNITQPNLLAVTLRKAGSVQRRDGDLAHITSLKAFHGYQTILKTATFTPANSSRLVVVSTALIPYGEAATHTTHATISGGGLTWTRHKRAYYSDSTGWTSAVYIWTAPVTTGASMAVTVTYSPSSSGEDGGWGLDVFELPDSYAIIQTFEDGGGSGDVLSGSYDGDFSTAPSSGSYLIAATSINSNTLDGSAMTPGSGWTEVSENVNAFYNSETQYVTGTTDTAVTWANLDPNINYSWAVGAIEIGEAGGAHYEIIASPGTYTVSGQTATLTKTTVRTIVASPSSYAIAGQTQTLRKGWKASQTSTGSLALSGQTATMSKLANLVITTTASSYAVTGQTQTLKHGWKTFATTASSYAMSGFAATLTYQATQAVSVTVNLGSLSMLMFAGRIVWPGETEGRQREGQMLEMGRWMGH